MARYVVINNSTNIVENAIVWDGIAPWTPPAGTHVIQSDTLNIGDTAS